MHRNPQGEKGKRKKREGNTPKTVRGLSIKQFLAWMGKSRLTDTTDTVSWTQLLESTGWKGCWWCRCRGRGAWKEEEMTCLGDLDYLYRGIREP